MLLTTPPELVVVDATEIIDARASTGPFEQYDNLAIDDDGWSACITFEKEIRQLQKVGEGAGGSGQLGSRN